VGLGKTVVKEDPYREKIGYFDAHVAAPWSAQEYGPAEWKKLERLFRYTGSIEGLKVLEPGCGTGRLTKILSQRLGPSGRVVALDISPKMIEAARTRLAGRRNVELHLGAVEDFPLGKGAFDLILCHQVFPHFHDKKRVLTHLASALRSRGKLIVFHFIPGVRINDRHRKAGTAVEGDLMPPFKVMKQMFQEAGFRVDLFLDDEEGYFLAACKG
jgi:demethylmenaquinone methyltransferase/2-methoxy-6-polyprenyl-1,4-benzoquinol methylase